MPAGGAVKGGVAVAPAQAGGVAVAPAQAGGITLAPVAFDLIDFVVSWWHFDEEFSSYTGSNLAQDAHADNDLYGLDIGNVTNPKPQNGGVSDRYARWAVGFNPGLRLVTFPASEVFEFGSHDFSVSGWVRMTSTGEATSSDEIFTIGDGTRSIELRTEPAPVPRGGGDPKFLVVDVRTVEAGLETVKLSAETIDNDQWHFFALRKRGQAITLDYNETRQSATIAGRTLIATDGVISAGRAWPSLSANTLGLDELGVWRRELDDAQVDILRGRTAQSFYPFPIPGGTGALLGAGRLAAFRLGESGA